MTVRAFLPNALSARVLARHDGRILADMVQGSLPGLFTAHLDEAHPYLLQIGWAGGEQVTEDPYSFGPQLGDMDLYLFAEGNHRDLSGRFGAQPTQVEGVDGVCFSVWAPNARRVSVVGDFNNWDGRRHPCACATVLACGSCSCRAWVWAKPTSSKCSARTAYCR